MSKLKLGDKVKTSHGKGIVVNLKPRGDMVEAGDVTVQIQNNRFVLYNINKN